MRVLLWLQNNVFTHGNLFLKKHKKNVNYYICILLYFHVQKIVRSDLCKNCVF